MRQNIQFLIGGFTVAMLVQCWFNNAQADLNHPSYEARKTYEQTKSQQADLREWERQRDEEMRKACEAYKNRLYKTPMNTRSPALCAPYWGE